MPNSELYPPYSPEEPYWAELPVIRAVDGNVELIRGDLAAAGTSIDAVTALVGASAPPTGDDDRFGVVTNPFGFLGLLPVGVWPKEDWRKIHRVEFHDGWSDQIHQCLARAEKIAADIRLATELGWELIDGFYDDLPLIEPAYRAARRLSDDH